MLIVIIKHVSCRFNCLKILSLQQIKEIYFPSIGLRNDIFIKRQLLPNYLSNAFFPGV
jgi:hypothetical protein